MKRLLSLLMLLCPLPQSISPQNISPLIIGVHNELFTADTLGQTVNDGYGDYVLVPAGDFKMGNNVSVETTLDQKPVHTVTLDAYYIGRYEVTNREYAKFIADSGYVTPAWWTAGGFGEYGNQPYYWTQAAFKGGGIAGNEQYPVVTVSWYEAQAYCAWLSVRTGKTYRLPTEAEWEKAARGTDQRLYPWGNSVDKSFANYYQNGDPFSSVSPVGFFNGSTHDGFVTHNNASPCGAFDMAGNMNEWCSDWYDSTYYSISPSNNPTGPETGTRKVLRGGCFFDDNSRLRSAFRIHYRPTLRGSVFGIRCVRVADVTTDIKDFSDNSSLPKFFLLYQNYPNPFNPQTTLEYDLPQTARVTVKIFNALGQELATLVEDRQPAGRHRVIFNGSAYPSGVYFYRLYAGEDFVETKKMLLLR